MRELLSAVDVSNELQIPTATLSTWRTRGGGPAFVKLGRAVRYRRADLEAWISANSKAHT